MILKIAYAAQICAILKEDSDLFVLPYRVKTGTGESEFVFYQRRRSMHLVLECFKGTRVPSFSQTEELDVACISALLENGAVALNFDEDKKGWALYASEKIRDVLSRLPKTIPLFGVKPEYFATLELAMERVSELEGSSVC